MARPDLERVLEIEHAVFAAPWSRASFEGELGNDSALPLVAELDSAVVAYMISWLVVDELHIGNIAVAPVAQRRGIGRDLLTFCLREAASRGVAYATLEVRVSNDRAIKLYEGFGFMPVALRRAYYSDTGEDALVMLKQFDRDEGSGG
jgi:ribosomal-protein-alanine N-acetyltransferase